MDSVFGNTERVECFQNGFHKPGFGCLSGVFGRESIPFADRRTAGKDLDRRRIGNMFADKIEIDTTGVVVLPVAGGLRLAAEGVDDLQPIRMPVSQLVELSPEDDIGSCLVAIDHGVTELWLRRQSVFEDAHVGYDPRAGTNVHQMIGPVPDVVG